MGRFRTKCKEPGCCEYSNLVAFGSGEYLTSLTTSITSESIDGMHDALDKVKSHSASYSTHDVEVSTEHARFVQVPFSDRLKQISSHRCYKLGVECILQI